MTFRSSIVCLLMVAVAAPLAAADRYTVTLRLLPGDDLSLVAQQLAATHGVQIESIAGERDEVVISGSDSRMRLLRTSPHVIRVDSAAAPFTVGPYGYDGSGNITNIGTDTFVYDSAGRIVSGTAGANRRQDYTYDAFGNLRTITTAGNAEPVKLHVDPATNQASAPAAPSPAFNAYGDYDAAGNMIAFGDAGPFVYDGAGMITGSTMAGRRTVYLYTPSDERIASITLEKVGTSQWVEGQSEWTLRGPDQKILRRFLRSPNGTWTWDEDYVYRRGLLLAAEVNRPEKTLRFHLDHLGTPRLITGNGGAEVTRHAYYPFGLEATTTTSSERLEFTGHERDQPNLDYMHARYYNGGWGRFLSVDPVLDIKEATKHPQGWNRYAYVRNNPLRFTDPTGKYQCEGSRNDCATIRNAYNDLRRAAANLPRGSDERNRVNAALRFLGRPGQANGVTVRVGSVQGRAGETGTTAHRAPVGPTGYTTQIGVDLSNIAASLGGRNQPAFAPEVSATLAHETQHGIDQRRNGMSTTRAQIFTGEVNAFTTSAATYRGLDFESGWQVWTRANGFDAEAVQRAAEQATQNWCDSPGANCQ